MRKVLFKDNFVDVDEEFLEDLKREYYMSLGAYKMKLDDVQKISSNYANKTEAKQVLGLIKAMLAKRSTVGTEELEGYKPNLSELEKNLKESKFKLTDENGVALDILKAYLNYDLPKDILTRENIVDIHKMLFNNDKEKYKAGKLRKKGDNNVMVKSSEKEFVDSALVSKYMDKFVLYYNANLSLEPITKAAMLHGIFVGIHPFKDGNGRTTRFITDKFISKELGVPLYLSESINGYSDNTEYTRALDQFHLESNSLPLIRFYYQVAISQLKTNIELISNWIENIFVTASKLSKKKVQDKYINDLAIYLTDAKYIYTKELAEELNITAATASTIIDSLVEKKILGDSTVRGRLILYKVKI